MIEKAVCVEVFRRRDEPTLQIGESILIKEGFVGVVLARFTPHSDPATVGYMIEQRRTPSLRDPNLAESSSR
jgi:hypothetical protein